jgi:hypothetical protein
MDNLDNWSKDATNVYNALKAVPSSMAHKIENLKTLIHLKREVIL